MIDSLSISAIPWHAQAIRWSSYSYKNRGS